MNTHVKHCAILAILAENGPAQYHCQWYGDREKVMIKEIAFTICGEMLCGEPCGGCAKDNGKCTYILTAKCIYTAHVKPLENALARAEDDKAVLIDALEKMLKAYEMILPGVAKIAVQDYKLLNDAPCAATSALARVKDKNND